MLPTDVGIWKTILFLLHVGSFWNLNASPCKSIATLGANGDANGPQRCPGFQELPTVARSMVTPRQASATNLSWTAGA